MANNDMSGNLRGFSVPKLQHLVGQQDVVKHLEIAIKASQRLKEPVPHILFEGPPGLGKSTFAVAVANQLGTKLQMVSSAAIAKPQDVLPYLTNLDDNSVLFISDIHRLSKSVAEFLCPAVEDFRVEIVLGDGMNARTIHMNLKRFTLIGSTTSSALPSSRMREAFELHGFFELYSSEDLAKMLRMFADKLAVTITDEACTEIGQRSRGTPRVANSHLRWIRNYSASEADGHITLDVAKHALNLSQVDNQGLDKQNRRYLEVLTSVFKGGPAGIEALSATLNVPVENLSDEVEPFLLRELFITRTPRGRVATAKAYHHLEMYNHANATQYPLHKDDVTK